MVEPTLNTLIQRLDRLERENRWWRVLGSATFVILSCLALVAATTATPKDEIRAEKFVVVDDDGRTRGEFGQLRFEASKDGFRTGSWGLSLQDGAGKTRVVLELDEFETEHVRTSDLRLVFRDEDNDREV